MTHTLTGPRRALPQDDPLPRNTKRLRDARRHFLDFSFILPALAFFCFVILIPLVNGIPIAFTNWNGLSPTREFTGLRNLQLLFTDPSVLEPVKNTLVFTLLTTIFINGFGLLIASGLNERFRGSKVLRSVVFMPTVVSLVLAAVMWTYLYNTVSYQWFHQLSPLASPEWVMVGISGIAIWRDTGLAVIIYLAAMQTIPKELYDAAAVDGAGAVTQWRHVTIPALAPAFTYTIPLFFALGLKMFDYSYVATRGGPGSSSETIAMYVYDNQFPYFKAGYGQMASLVLLLVSLTFMIAFTSMLRRREISA
ncbi:carbohydrate ABC transporter permease [Leifsonia sp. 22587]|uniref:carbohydrate ABC transporter permease n=1 Tax=Leifsonia sp. 22587 TaxID=3453946 RepID=UPI003F862873